MTEIRQVVKISPSSLNLFLECPRCFWLQMNKGFRRPKGPSSTLPSGVDYTLKAYFDYWRKQGGEPPILRGKLPGKLLTKQDMISKFRSRSFGIFDTEAQAYFMGMLDDALELPDGSIVPLDNKTRGFPPTEVHPSYQNQMGAYTLFLRENNLPTKNLAYLVYWFFDHKNMDLERPLDFNISVKEIKTEPDRMRAVFRAAVSLLRQEIMPDAADNCTFCRYRRGLEKN